MDLNRVGFSPNRKPQPATPAEKPFEQAVDELVYMRGADIARRQWDQSPTVDSRMVGLLAYCQIEHEIISLDPSRTVERTE